MPIIISKENTEARKLSKSHWVFDFDMPGSSLLNQGNHHSSIDSSRSPFPSKFELSTQNLGEHKKKSQYVSLPQPAQFSSKRHNLQPAMAASVADIKAATTATTKTKRIVCEDVMLCVLYAVLYVGELSPPEIHFQSRLSHPSPFVYLVLPVLSLFPLFCRFPPHMFEPRQHSLTCTERVRKVLVAVGIEW